MIGSKLFSVALELLKISVRRSGFMTIPHSADVCGQRIL